MRRALPALVATLALSASALAQPRGPAVEQDPFGKIPARKDDRGKDVPAQPVTRYALVNKNGAVVKCIDYGAIITEINVPDKNGKFADVALGYDKLEGYLKGHLRTLARTPGRKRQPHRERQVQARRQGIRSRGQ